jgi:hypothetical protein
MQSGLTSGSAIRSGARAGVCSMHYWMRPVTKDRFSQPGGSQWQAALGRCPRIGRGSKSTEEVRIEVVRAYPL